MIKKLQSLKSNQGFMRILRLFSYAQSFVGLFAAIVTLKLKRYVVRELVKDKNHRDELTWKANQPDLGHRI